MTRYTSGYIKPHLVHTKGTLREINRYYRYLFDWTLSCSITNPSVPFDQTVSLLSEVSICVCMYGVRSPSPSPRLLRCDPGVAEALGSCSSFLGNQIQHGEEEAAEALRLLPRPLVLLHQDLQEPPWLQLSDVPQLTCETHTHTKIYSVINIYKGTRSKCMFIILH